MTGTEGISVADALALTKNGAGYGNDGMFGGNGAWWIIILILFFGYGRGFGNYGNEGNGNGGYSACCTPATAQGVTDAFNFNQLDNGIRGLERGLCDGFYTTSTNINGVTNAIQNCCCSTKEAISNLGYQTAQGFNGVDKSICQLGYNTQSGFNAIGTQLASCCCDIQRGQDSIRNELSQTANALLVANERNTDRIINHLTQTEMDALRTELQSAQFQLSQNAQTNNIINQLLPVAKPAYLTCSPYAAAFGMNSYGYTGCGCSNCA